MLLESALLITIWIALGTIFAIALCISSVAAFYAWHDNLERTKQYRNIPTFKMRSFLGYWQWLTIMHSKKNPYSFFFQFINGLWKLHENDGILIVWIWLRPLVIIFRPEYVEVLLSNSVTIEKSMEYNFLKPWLGTGLLTSGGNKWRSRRKLLTPTFHFRILENFVSVFNEQSAVLVKKLEECSREQWINIAPPVTKCTLDIICETAMGLRMNIQSGECKEYVNAISEISNMFIYRFLRPWLWLDFLFMYVSPSGWRFRKNLKHVHEFTRKVIKEKKDRMLQRSSEYETQEKSQKKKFLELLLEHHFQDESFTEEDIREEVDTFMFEGHDTTAMGISWALYNLGLCHDIQDKVFEELEEIFQGDQERPITLEDIKNMKYLERVIKESQRLYPSVPIIAREIQTSINVGGYTLAPGTLCAVMTYSQHRDPKLFPDPEKFDPDRFLPENSADRHHYAYIPFSAGPRNCIGQRFALMEEKTVLAYILRKFKLTSLDSRDKVNLMTGLTLKNTDPLRIRLSLRSS